MEETDKKVDDEEEEEGREQEEEVLALQGHRLQDTDNTVKTDNS